MGIGSAKELANANPDDLATEIIGVSSCGIQSHWLRRLSPLVRMLFSHWLQRQQKGGLSTDTYHDWCGGSWIDYSAGAIGQG